MIVYCETRPSLPPALIGIFAVRQSRCIARIPFSSQALACSGIVMLAGLRTPYSMLSSQNINPLVSVANCAYAGV
jgi:hypothetical protein